MNAKKLLIVFDLSGSVINFDKNFSVKYKLCTVLNVFILRFFICSHVVFPVWEEHRAPPMVPILAEPSGVSTTLDDN